MSKVISVEGGTQASFFDIIDSQKSKLTSPKAALQVVPQSVARLEDEGFSYKGSVYTREELESMLEKFRSFGYSPTVPERVLEGVLGIGDSPEIRKSSLSGDNTTGRRPSRGGNRSMGVHSPIDGASHMAWSNKRAWARRS